MTPFTWLPCGLNGMWHQVVNDPNRFKCLGPQTSQENWCSLSGGWWNLHDYSPRESFISTWRCTNWMNPEKTSGCGECLWCHYVFVSNMFEFCPNNSQLKVHLLVLVVWQNKVHLVLVWISFRNMGDCQVLSPVLSQLYACMMPPPWIDTTWIVFFQEELNLKFWFSLHLLDHQDTQSIFLKCVDFAIYVSDLEFQY